MLECQGPSGSAQGLPKGETETSDENPPVILPKIGQGTVYLFSWKFISNGRLPGDQNPIIGCRYWYVVKRQELEQNNPWRCVLVWFLAV